MKLRKYKNVKLKYKCENTNCDKSTFKEFITDGIVIYYCLDHWYKMVLKNEGVKKYAKTRTI